MLEIQRKLTNQFYAILALPATAMGFALSVQISALSWILSTQYGLDIKDVGLVWAAGPIAGILGQVIVGIISDKVWFWDGRRRPFILIGGVLSALMLLALPNIGVITDALGIDGILGVAITIALVLDLAINVSFNPTRSIIADVTPEGRPRTKGYTWMQTVSGSFGVLAYAIGAVFGNFALIYFGVFLVLAFSLIPPFFVKEPRTLAEEDPADLTPSAAGGSAQQAAEEHHKSDGSSAEEIIRIIYPLWGFAGYSVYALATRLGVPAVPYYIMEIVFGVATLLLITKALLTKEEGHSREVGGLIGFQKVLAAHSFTWIGVQTMFIYLYAYVDFSFPEITDLQLGRIVSLSFLFLNLVGALLPAFVLEPYAAKIGRVKTHMISIAVMAFGYLGVLFLGVNAVMIYIMMAVVGVGWAATISLPFAIMSQKIPKAKMGLYMGLFNLSVVLPQLVASLGVGEAINNAADKSITLWICAITVGISALAWSMVKEPVDR
ncbi:MAG: MFS transporter, partial [Balneolales bacterium]|nr:MFS transporter [Balneolales bacterium]